MIDPLESSKRKVARSEQHLQSLAEEIRKFIESKPYERVTEPHPDKAGFIVDKIKLTKKLPDSLADTTADVVQNLRNALDNAGYAIAVASGVMNPKYSSFPFAGSITDFPNALNGRCKDLPKEIQSLFAGFMPYPDGDDFLWALNEICNMDKHRIVIPIGSSVVRTGAHVQGTGYFSMPNPHVWNREKNEMDLITLGPGATHSYFFDFRISVAFNEVKLIDGQQVLKVLHAVGTKVQRIIAAIESECKRLKIFP